MRFESGFEGENGIFLFYLNLIKNIIENDNFLMDETFFIAPSGFEQMLSTSVFFGKAIPVVYYLMENKKEIT